MAKYTAEILECKATIRVYLERPVAIGEHPQHLEEVDKLVERMTDSSDKLDTLKKNFAEYL